jgi:hypothetical protein
MSVSDPDNPVVADGNTMSVLSQVLHHMLLISQRSLAVDDPLFKSCPSELGIKTIRISGLSELPLNAVKEFSFEGITKLMYRVEVVFKLSDAFPSAIESISDGQYRLDKACKQKLIC